MDILRSALEQARTAEEAAAFIGDFVERHDQGGNGAYKGTLVYDNSYIAADWDGAWVIETAGHRWAARRTDGPAAISNTYSLTEAFDRADPLTLSRRGPGFSWKRSIESRLYRFITKGDTRRACALAGMSAAPAGRADTGGILSLMRSHGPYDITRPNRRNMESICMHEGGLVNNATTASMVVRFDPSTRAAVIWYTASPSPCISLYRPAVLEDGAFRLLWTDYDHAEGAESSTEYWTCRRAAARRLQRTAFHDPAFAVRRDTAQRELQDLVDARTEPADDQRISARVNQIIHEFESGA
jgi:secernin